MFFVFCLQSCSTYKAQFGKDITNSIVDIPSDKELSHQFFLIGDAGNADQQEAKEVLSMFKNKLQKANKESTLLFLGDNIYPIGMPTDKTSEERILAELKLTTQLELSKDFKGKTVFIPGNHDWYYGIKGLQEQEKFVTKYLKDKKGFLPRNSCPIERLKINEDVVLIVVDSQWVLEDWNKQPTINDDCDIKTREGFYDELKSQLNKNQNKTIILALHHPLLTNGTHGGQFSIEKQLFPFENKIPLPGIAGLINFLRKTTGASPQDIQNKQYRSLANRIKTMIYNRKNVIVVSGHDHNLQYIDHDNVKQIISGSASKKEAARAIYPNDFSYGNHGYAILNIYQDQSAIVHFYSVENNEEKLVFAQEILPATSDKDYSYLATAFPTTTDASIYTEEMTEKSGFYRFLLGNHYRTYYSKKINVPTLQIDTLYGGLTPLRAGGGNQSNSLRLVDKDGKEYVMRGLKKSATRFVQNLAYQEKYMVDKFEETGAESFLLDFYTTTHPYFPFIISGLAKPIDIYHTNPELYYVPKQKALGKFNDIYGDELYMIEERPMSEQSNIENFGEADDIISTSDVLLNLRKNEKSKIDENAYIRARLFDMLLGDWDRHSDQWRWSEFQDGKNNLYRPIPRDRDQVFPKYDGLLISLIMRIPALRHMQHFDEDIRNLKWFNMEPYPMDLAFVTQTDEKTWIDQAKYIQENLSDEDIDNAFAQLPKDLQDETVEKVKTLLKHRKQHLETWAKEYYAVLNKTVIIVGTDKKERFIINRLPDGNTEVKMFRIKRETEELILHKTYSNDTTKEIWIYGLDDNDIFEVQGVSSKKMIKIRLIGGQNNDTYQIENGKRIIIYDFKTKKNTLQVDGKTTVKLTDNYNTNVYDYKRPKYNALSTLPNIGYNPDDGIKLGILSSYAVNHFNRDPFSQKHNLSVLFYTATKGLGVSYQGVFVNTIGKWDLGIEALYTSPSYSINYFGNGNETENNDSDLGMDYNRVKIQSIRFAPSIFKEGKSGSKTELQIGVENIKIENTPGRFVHEFEELHTEVFKNNPFAETAIKYSYINYDHPALPSLGFTFESQAMWKVNLKDTKRNFSYLETALGFTHKISKNEMLTFSTLFRGKALLNDEYEFYQGAFLGGDTDLRGYRNQRFLGKYSYSQTTDIRLTLASVNKTFIPLKVGVFGGYDYGRVWEKNDNSNQWHQSYGGGLWLTGAELLTARVSYFNSIEGGRIGFGVGFGF
ncbi:metallophosphoesterase [Gelidibacter japonicus]|uniref:metallophosphoesterase n=1 Tax=Gelidibacter japonicus TaxID=1962232 RepID=UPI001F085BEF|nr:metallophosphoesterase [Gelidibacter japonicus]